MQWGSVAEFFAMGGYGLYVWPSFGVAALCMGGGDFRGVAKACRGVREP